MKEDVKQEEKIKKNEILLLILKFFFRFDILMILKKIIVKMKFDKLILGK